MNTNILNDSNSSLVETDVNKQNSVVNPTSMKTFSFH